jgi:hypothetical protein
VVLFDFSITTYHCIRGQQKILEGMAIFFSYLTQGWTHGALEIRTTPVGKNNIQNKVYLELNNKKKIK